MSDQKEPFIQLSNEQKENLKKELAELYKWKDDESKKLETRLREEGKWELRAGLDVNQHYFKDIVNEFQNRFHKLGVKYGILHEKGQKEDGA